MTDTSYRKIDIDQFDEDRLTAQDLYEPDPRDPHQATEIAKTKQAEVRGCLSR
jgi:actin related protein 2/3 complex, subunit 5